VGLENLSRFGAIYLWRNVNVLNLISGSGIEASFRVIKPNKYTEIIGDLGKIAFDAYERAREAGIPEQDARYMLFEGTLTRMVFSASPRSLLKLANILEGSELDELKEIAADLKKIVSENFGLEFPEEKSPSLWKFWGQESIENGVFADCRGNVSSISLTMGIEGSLAMYAQLVRQRQILCEIEPLESISGKAAFVIPPTFTQETIDDYKRIAKLAYEEQTKRIKENDPNFVYFLLLGQNAASTIYGKGAGVIETAKSRSEGVAQWEIRNVVGIPLVESLSKYDDLCEKIGPRCWREKRCIEPAMFKSKKAICPAFAKNTGNWQGDLGELMKVLKEPYQKFTLG
jgi:hypothetical protein